MKNSDLKYLAVISAFAATFFAFQADATLPGLLAGLSGILTAATIRFRKGK